MSLWMTQATLKASMMLICSSFSSNPIVLSPVRGFDHFVNAFSCQYNVIHDLMTGEKKAQEAVSVFMYTFIVSTWWLAEDQQSQVTSWLSPPPWTSSSWTPPSWPGDAPLCAYVPPSSWYDELQPGHCGTGRESGVDTAFKSKSTAYQLVFYIIFQ